MLLLVKRRAQCQYYRAGMSLSWIPPNDGKRVGREMSGDQYSECFLSRSCSYSVRWREANFEAFMLSSSCCSLKLQLPLHPILTPFSSSFATFSVLRVIFNTWSTMGSNSGAIPNQPRVVWSMDVYPKLFRACEPLIHKRETLLPRHGRDLTALLDP